VFKLNSTLSASGGAEGPAASALALIFNTSDGTFRNPVKGARGVSLDLVDAWDRGSLASQTNFWFVSEVNVLEFSGSQIGKFVGLSDVGVVAGVVSSDDFPRSYQLPVPHQRLHPPTYAAIKKASGSTSHTCA